MRPWTPGIGWQGWWAGTDSQCFGAGLPVDGSEEDLKLWRCVHTKLELCL